MANQRKMQHFSKWREITAKNVVEKNCIIAEFLNLENLRIWSVLFSFLWNKITSNHFWCWSKLIQRCIFFCRFPTWFILSTQKNPHFSIKFFWVHFICFLGYCNLWPSCWKFKIQRNHLKTSRAVCYRRWVILFNIKLNMKFSYCSTFQFCNCILL